MIINTGMRTDIPAFYSEWFMNRIRKRYGITIKACAEGMTLHLTAWTATAV